MAGSTIKGKARVLIRAHFVDSRINHALFLNLVVKLFLLFESFVCKFDLFVEVPQANVDYREGKDYRENQ